MPNPAKYKDQASFMSDCMRVTKSEGLTHDQCLGKCLGMWKGKSKEASTDYSKYLFVTPQDHAGLQYYVLRIPKEDTPPKEGEHLVLKGDKVVVQSVSTPEDIAKGRGGPVARSMEQAGIGWNVNCLPEGHEWLKRAKIAGKLQKDIDKAKSQNDLPSVFLGGSCDDNNAWRKNVKEEFKGKFFFVDPYDPEWEAEDNIYEELAAILNVDHIIFYKGGKGTEREKKFMDNTDKDYKSFEGLDELKSHLKAIIPPALKKACVSDFLRKIASRLIEASYSYSMIGIEVPAPIANRLKKWTNETIPESEIYEKEEDKHITVVYGLDSKDLEAVKEFLKGVKPFTVTLNKTSMFWNDKKSDVLKISVNSPELQKLHAELKEEFKPAKQFPEYNPHITLTYLKKGYVEKYLDDDYSDISFDVNTLTFYDNDSKKTHIKLDGR